MGVADKTIKNTKKYNMGNSSRRMLPEDYTPQAKDIICGRGNLFSDHEGNQFFEKLIRDNLRKYVETVKRSEKIRMVDDILRTIRTSGTRFAKVDSVTKRWFELNDTQAHKKIGHCIRHKIRLHGLRPTKKISSSEQQSKVRTKTNAATPTKPPSTRLFLLENEFPERNLDYSPSHFFGTENEFPQRNLDFSTPHLIPEDDP